MRLPNLRGPAALCLALSGLTPWTGKAQSTITPANTLANNVEQAASTEVNFTGPLIATSPVALDPGHFNIEPYLLWGDNRGGFDRHRNWHGAKRDQRTWTSTTPFFFGIAPNLNAQFILNASHTTTPQGRTDGLRMADTTVRLLYQLTRAEAHTSQPAIGLIIGKSIPSGSYKHLGGNPLNGTGTGSRAWSVTLASQTYFWLANGHVLRMRFNLGWVTRSQRIGISGVNVYDTPDHFAGWAHRGHQGTATLAFEYTLNSRWVLATDFVYTRFSANRVYQRQPDGGSKLYSDSGGGDRLQWAPAVEYNWNGHIGLIGGVQLTPWGRNTSRVVTPQLALNIYY